MARCILVLALCFTFALPFVWSRRISHDNKVAPAYVAPQPQHGIEHSHTRSTIFANGFDYGTDEEALKKHFGAVGAMRDLHFQSRGAAVITYEAPSAATRALNELHETTMEGQRRYVEVKLDDPDRERKVEKAKGKGRPSGRTIFVNGFDFKTDDDALTNHFGTVGAIEDHFFQSKGSAVITYAKASSAQRAITALGGTTMPGQKRYVDVKLNIPLRKGSDTAGQEGKAASQTSVGK